MNQDVMKEMEFENNILKQVTELQGRMQTSDAMSQPKVYFVTTTYNDIFAHMEIEKKLHLAKKLQDGFFMYMMGKILPKYQKPNQRYKQPISIDFHDFPETNGGYANLIKSPHTHSIFLVHQETQERFEALRKRKFDLDKPTSKTDHIQSVDCQILETIEDLRHVISYSSKFYKRPGSLKHQPELHSLVYSARGGERSNKMEGHRKLNPTSQL